ncbi:MAG: hypothetical protein HRU09_07005 [Oligoflexales bacterium]|nr:hypothetical protein [Oligoflexales bacterium]
MVKEIMLMGLVMLHLSGPSVFAKNSNHYKKLMNRWQQPTFDISKAATKEDWTFFMQSTTPWKRKLWQYHQRQGKSLGDWSWTWRSGWLQVCGQTPKKWCLQILQSALFDKALVIRAKAAQIWGRLYSGTGNSSIGDLLEKAYQLKANNRNGKPLFVKKRILFALKSIGGDKNLSKGKALVKTDSQMQAYWERL